MELQLDGRVVFVAGGGGPFHPDAPTVALIHGAGMDHSVWAHQSRALAQAGMNVLAPDLPDHGRSEGPALTSIAAMSDWLAQLFDTLGAPAATVAGHSMGGLIALDFVDRHPQRCRGAVLLGAAARMPVHHDLLAAARDDRPRAIEMILGWAFAPGAELAPSPVPGVSLIGAARALLRRAAPGVLHADLAACDAYAHGAAAAARATRPVTLIHGDQDRMAPLKAARALADALAQPTLAVIPGAGHMVMLEDPLTTLTALRAAL